MIRRDPAWQEGNYTADAIPVQGMRLARKLGMITYRSAKEWAQRFGRERASAERKPGDPFGIDFEVESYLESHATKFTGQYDPNCYLYISRAMDLFDLADHGGSVQDALKRFTVERALIIGVETDLLFPIEQQQELADGLAAGGREVQFVRMPSLQGHDSFLVDMDRFRPVVGDFLQQKTRARRKGCEVRLQPDSGAVSASLTYRSRNSAGSTIARFSATPQCRCGPVTRPVAPTVPSRSPAAQLVADLHFDLFEMAVHRHQAVAVVDEQRVAVEEEVAGLDHGA